ncbi:MAG: hypothetical protein JST65_18210 [Acidobacteria bacterium]|nr:hypothetical protein [Acidobacteriota bacterium]
MLREVVISVFGLFHPGELEIAPAGPTAIDVICGTDEHTRLEGPARKFRLHAGCRTKGLFSLSIPGRIERTFAGTLSIEPGLTALITMDLEAAVASTVAAELPATTSPSALEAQAIAVRSYYASLPAGRHAYASFCDTTHCQHIRGTLPPDHPASLATQATRGLVLDYRSKVVTAMYSAACSGRRQAGVANSDGYAYSAVECRYCLRRPSAKKFAHARGLCQAGAADMAANGKSAEEILRHYYPGTSLRALARD